MSSTYISPEAQAAHNISVAQVATLNQRRGLINAGIFILNFPILVLILMGLSQIHFITIITPDAGAWTIFAVTAMLALVFMVVRKIAGILTGLFVLFTCCVGAIFLPVFYIAVGYVTLLTMAWLLPSYIAVSPNLLYGILAGLVIGIGQIPELAHVADPPAPKSEAQQAKELAAKAARD